MLRLAMLRGKLLERESKRIRPGLDDKVLADWNGLMIAALANAGALLGEPAGSRWRPRLRLHRRGHDPRRPARPFLARRAAAVPRTRLRLRRMVRAALALHEATGERSYLDQALAWQHALDRHYANPDNGGYFLTADDAEGLVVRPASTHDDAIPNPNGDRGAKSRPARGADRRRCVARDRPTR